MRRHGLGDRMVVIPGDHTESQGHERRTVLQSESDLPTA
jgi:hypothetical protein